MTAPRPHAELAALQTMTDELRIGARNAAMAGINGWGKLCSDAADTIDTLRAQLAEAQDALQAAQRLFKEALPKFNWGASFLDANAIQVLNEVPAKVNAAIRAAKVEKNGA